MIWATLMRVGAALSLAGAVMEVRNHFAPEVKPNRLYSSKESARFIGVDRKTVVKMVRNNELQGKLIEGNFRILGQSILEYLKK